MCINIALTKPTLIDLEARQRVTRRKRKQRERLNEMGRKACDSLNTTNNKMKVVRKIRSGLSATKVVVTNLDGGFAKSDQFYLEFNGIPVVADKDCPQRLFFLPNEVLTNYVLAEMEFARQVMFIGEQKLDKNGERCDANPVLTSEVTIH